MTTETKVNPDPRAEYIHGLRMLADLLEQHPDLGLPFEGNTAEMMVFINRTDGQRERLARWASVLPGTKTKSGAGTGDTLFALHAKLRGFSLKVIADRDEVCEKVVTGVETVTKKVKDPQALAAVPEVEVTEEVETYEWRCTSIFAGADA